jgi:hypothetical protein
VVWARYGLFWDFCVGLKKSSKNVFSVVLHFVSFQIWLKENSYSVKIKYDLFKIKTVTTFVMQGGRYAMDG